MKAVKLIFGFAFALLFMNSDKAFAQSDTVHLYYPINENRVDPVRHQLIEAVSEGKGSITAITIIGYADYLGSKNYNQALSTARAENVKVFLHQLIPVVRITSIGMGELPFTGLKNKEGASQDRRVDLILQMLPQPVAVVESKPDTLSVQTPVAAFRDTVFEAKVETLAFLKRGDKLDIDELLFEAGRHILTKASYQYADILLDILKKHTKLKIKLIGHICCDYNNRDGFDYDNKKYGLSKYRAQFLYEYLVKAGIDESRMSYKGVGSTDPKVYPEVTPEDASRNRRVEIVVISNKQ